MAHPLGGKVDAHRALAEIAQDDALAEAAAMFSGAAEIRNQLLALGQNRTAISNISIAVTLQFEGKLRVSRPSISERAPCPP